MAGYLSLVFLHVLSAVALFGAWGMEAAALGQLLQATASPAVRAGLALRRRAQPIAGLSMLTLVVTGMILVRLRGGGAPWALAALLALVLLVPMGVVLERRARRALGGARDGVGAGVPPVIALLAGALWLRVGVGVGIVAVMTFKPGAGPSAVVLAAAAALGATMALRAQRRRPAPAAS